MAEIRSGITADSGRMQAARLVSRSLIAVSGVVLARILGPELLGMLTIPMLVITYSAFFSFGLVESLTREIPLLTGRGARQELLRSQQNIFTATLLVTLALVLILPLWRLGNPQLITPDPLLFAFVTGGIACMLGFRMLYVITASRRNFRSIARMLTAQGALRLGSVLLLLWLLPGRDKLYAQPTGLLLSLLLGMFLLWPGARFPLRLRLEPRRIWELQRIGFFIALYALILNMLSTADTFVLKPRLSPEFLGYYQIGNLVRDTLLLFTSSVAGVALPAYGQLFGATGSRQALESKYLTHIFYLALFIPLLCAAAWFLLPPAVALVMPRFLPGAQHLSGLALSMAPLMLVPLPASLLIVIGKQRQLIAVMGGFLGLLLLVNSWWIGSENITSSPLLNTVIYWLLVVVLVSYTHFLLSNGMKNLFRLLRFLLPLLLGTLLLWTPLLFFTSGPAPTGVALLVFTCYPFLMFWFHKRRDPRIQAMKIVGKKDKSHE